MINETNASTSVIQAVLQTWQKFGLFQVVLPFLLVFAIVYGVLERTKMFGEKGPAVNAIIAFTIAMTSVLTSWFVGFITGFLPWISILAIIVIAAMMLLAMFTGDFDKLVSNPTVRKIGMLAIAVAIIGILIGMAFSSGLQFNLAAMLGAIGLTTTDLWGIIFFLAFLGIIYLMSRGGHKASGGEKS